MGILAVGSGAVGAALESGNGTVSDLAGSSPLTQTPATEPIAKVAAAVLPSVVSVTVDGAHASDEGAGVVLRSDGVILTNNHVVAAAASGGSITVQLADGRTVGASILGRDPTSDLAVIRAHGVSGLRPAVLGSARTLHVGDTVLAIGSPLGLAGSVSSGIVSALHRTVDLTDESNGGLLAPSQPGPTTPVVTNAIQTDAPINPGNSGGPLVNLAGQVVGIDTAIATLSNPSAGTQSGSIGVGFAIPVDEARQVAAALLAGRRPTHAVLGVEVTDAPDGGGALVTAVSPGGPAAKAGLRSGDVIISFAGIAIDSADALSGAVREYAPGNTVRVSFRRGGRERTVQVTLAAAAG